MRSDDEALALVYERAAAIRRRQRLRTTTATGVLTAVVLVVGVVAAADGIDRRATVTAESPAGDPQGEPAVTTTTADPRAAEHPTTTPDPPSEGDEPPTAAPAPTTSPTSVPPPGACSVDAIELRVTSERPTYRPGERVVIHADGTNRSDHDCAPYESSETWIRHDNTEYGYGTATMAARTEPTVWRSGETLVVTLEWNQEVFDGERQQPAPPGAYTVTATWSLRDGDSDRHVSYTGSTTFEITEA